MANLLDRQNIAKASPPSGITGGTTTVTGITNGYILYNNAGVVGGLDPTTLSADITIGTSDVVGGTTGSILFVGASTKIQQDNANFFIDDTNNTLGVGTTRAAAISGTNPRLRVKGSGATSGTSSFEVQDSAAASLFLVRDDGLINLGSAGSYTNSSGQLALSTSGSGAGLLLGGDALLYRVSADVLRTPDSLIIDTNLTVGTTTGGEAKIVSRSAADTSTDYTFISENSSGVNLFTLAGNGDCFVNGRAGIGPGATIPTTSSLFVYNSTASQTAIAATSDSNDSITGNFVNSGTGANHALIVNSFNGTTNYAIAISNGDINFNTGTGTKIGTGTTEKFAFWGKTPIVQPTTAIAGAAFVANSSGIADDTATFGGYTLGKIAAALIAAGILA